MQSRIIPTGSRRRRWLVAAAVVAVALAAPAAALAARDHDPRVFPRSAHPYGMSYAEWTATWWPWALAEPDATNPVRDTTGADCAVGQPGGHVWLLASTFGGEATRECTVPKNRALLIPLVNTFWCAFPEDPPIEKTLAFIRAQMAFVRTQATELSASIDGVPVRGDLRDYFVESSAFQIVDSPQLPPGRVCDPSIDFGFYLLIKPLSRGQHTLRVTGGLLPSPVNGAFSTGVTYHLTVAR